VNNGLVNMGGLLTTTCQRVPLHIPDLSKHDRDFIEDTSMIADFILVVIWVSAWKSCVSVQDC
jgi:hypothetical protein